MAPYTSADNVCCWEIVQKWIFGREAKLRGQMQTIEGDLWDKNITNQHISTPERDLSSLDTVY